MRTCKTADDVVSFWLDEIGPEGWFKQEEELDTRIRDQFGSAWTDAIAGRLNEWKASTRGTLGYLILTDQFPRNMFRGTGQAFASDRLALAAAKGAIARGQDLKCSTEARQFFYMPLMHSESLADQERTICLSKMRLPADAQSVTEFAVKHRDVVRRFGRFPSRNAALGRNDSGPELAYRAAGGYMS